MQIRDINKPINSKTLNETLAKKFGTRLDVDSFTLEQLQDARNKIRTKLSQIETNESFSGLPKNETYSKNKLFLDILNAAISERADVEEAAKPDYIDLDGDGDKKEPMKKAAKDKKMKGLKKNESIVREGAEDKAELVMAAKDMVDRLTGWMEDTAEMQSESMLELADAIRDEMSQNDSDSFVNTVKPALEQLYASMETTRESLTAGVAMLTGEGAPAPDMGAPADDIPADVEPEEPAMEPTVDDDFGAAAPAAGGDEEAGRARRESRMYKKKAMLEQARRIGTILSKKK